MSSEDNEFNKDDKRLFTLREENPTKAVLKMGIPVTIGMLFMVVYNLTDTYFIGLMHDDFQLAAVNLSYPVIMIMAAVTGIVGNGGASYITRCMGTGYAFGITVIRQLYCIFRSFLYLIIYGDLEA